MMNSQPSTNPLTNLLGCTNSNGYQNLIDAWGRHYGLGQTQSSWFKPKIPGAFDLFGDPVRTKSRKSSSANPLAALDWTYELWG